MSADGTIAFEADGEAHRLRLGINAICLLEDRLGKSISAIALEMSTDPRITTIRALFWSALGDDKMTLDRAGQIIEALGIPKAAEIARDALRAAFPDPEPDGAEKAKGRRPRRAADG